MKFSKFSTSVVFLFIYNLLNLCTACTNNAKIPVTEVSMLANGKNNLVIKKWQILGPIYRDTSNNSAVKLINLDENTLNEYWQISENDLNEHNFCSFNKDNAINKSNNIQDVRNSSFEIQADYANLKEVMHPVDLPGDCYLGAVISSNQEQDVVFYERTGNGRKVWLNNKLLFNERVGHKHFFKGHLRKGNNFVKVKVSDISGDWFFHLNIFSNKYYATQFYVNRIFSNFLTSPVIREGYMTINLDSDFMKAEKACGLQVFDSHNSKIIDTILAKGNTWSIPVRKLPAGSYVCRLMVDEIPLEELFVVGDPKNLWQKLLKAYKPSMANENADLYIQPLINRYKLIDSVFNKDKDTVNYTKKIPFLVFELQRNLFNLSQSQQQKGLNEKGWHLRGYRSKIDNSLQYYMVYIPRYYNPQKPGSLMLTMPYVGGAKYPFYGSVHVANHDRTEMLARLADKYNVILLIPSCRIFEQYNYNQIVTNESFAALKEVKSYYSIDDKRIYLYGSCSGGIFAALLANRFPGIFAAIGLEGPEFSYTVSEKYPKEWLERNNIMKYSENYTGVPILVIHSKNDQKADFKLAQRFAELINQKGGSVMIDTLDNPNKSKKINLEHDDIIMPKMFEFFKGKVLKQPDTVKFSTSQLKYDKAYWITIIQRCSTDIASITGSVKPENTIEVSLKNICSFSIAFNTVPGLNKTRKVKVLVGNKLLFDDYLIRDSMVFTIHNHKQGVVLSKSHLIEGPVSDVFANSFLVVKGTQGTGADRYLFSCAADSFCLNWASFYLNEPMVKNDKDVTAKDILSNNLVLFGTDSTNLIIKKISKSLPFKTGQQWMSIHGKKHCGNFITYMIVYPNPLNPKRYVLIIGSNSPQFLSAQIKDLSLKGWFDFQVWDGARTIASGYFNNNWF
jgi:hypothetical protein